MMKENSYEEEIDLKDIVFVLKKGWKIIFLFSFLAAVAGLLVAFSQPHKYKAVAILRIGRAGGNLLEDVSDTTTVIKSNPSLKMIFSKFYGKEVSLEIAASKSSLIEISGKGRLMQVNTFGLSVQDAEKLGEIVVEEIMKRHQIFYEQAERDLKRYLTDVKVQFRSLQRIIGFGEFSNEPTVMEANPKAVDIPVNSRRKIVLLFLITGLLLGIFAVFIREYWEKINSGSS